MAVIRVGTIIFAVFLCTTFIISASLLSRSLYDYCIQKRKVSKSSSRKKPIGLTLISMSLFTVSLFMYCANFIIFLISGMPQSTLNLFNNIIYMAALFITLYIWIQRLDSTFHNSAYGYSQKYIRNLRRFYFVNLGIVVIITLQHIVVYVLDATRIITYLGGAVFILLFISLFIIVLYSFLRKMRESVKLSEKVDQTVSHENAHIGKRLVSLMVKFTILSVLCIVSTFFSLGLVVVFQVSFSEANHNHSWYIMQLPFVVDDFIGFITLFCTWSINKKVYYKLFGCVHYGIIKYKEESSTRGDSMRDEVAPPEETPPAVVVPQISPQISELQSQSDTNATYNTHIEV